MLDERAESGPEDDVTTFRSGLARPGSPFRPNRCPCGTGPGKQNFRKQFSVDPADCPDNQHLLSKSVKNHVDGIEAGLQR